MVAKAAKIASPKSRHIWMVTPEIPPLKTTGGLSDAVHGLSQSLVQAGHKVSVFVPQFTGTMENALLYLHEKKRPIKIAPLKSFPVKIDGRTEEAQMWTLTLPFSADSPKGLRYFFIDNSEGTIFRSRTRVFGYKDDVERYLFFNKAITEFLIRARAGVISHHRFPLLPDVIHYHDWATAFLGYCIRHCNPQLSDIPLAYSIHNLGYGKGVEMGEFAHLTGEHNSWVYSPEGMEFYGIIDAHKTGILFADGVITVSRQYAQEILAGKTHPAYANQYAGILQANQAKVKGILNGLPDYFGVDHFVSKKALPAGYTADDLTGKKTATLYLQQLAGLETSGQKMILVYSGRFTSQKGAQEIAAALPLILDENPDIQFVAIGSSSPGEKAINSALLALQEKYPGRAAILDFNEPAGNLFRENLEALVLAGGHYTLMPSVYEPCGLVQMKSLRLGTPVIANRTGGLADTVEDGKTGIFLESMTEAGITAALTKAYGLFKSSPETWAAMASDGMKKDFSWTNAVRHYVDVYEELIVATAARYRK